MTIEKLPSGNYRLKKQIDGKRYSITIDHKPSQKEAILLLSELLGAKGKDESELTFNDCANEYLNSRHNVLSPSTRQGYHAILRRLPDYFKQMKITEIDQKVIQSYINESALTHSPKTVANEHGFITAVFRFFYPDMNFSTRLPKKQRHEPNIPSEDDFKKVYDAINERSKIAFELTAYGLRRSEICALTMNDLKENTLTITKAMVQGEDNKWYVKNTPKSDAGYRTVYISADLADRIRAKGSIFDGTPANLSNDFSYAIKKSGVKKFTLHKMRHYFASHAHQMGIPEADILKMGGWDSDYVMKQHYRHSLSHEESAKKYASDISTFF